MVRAQPGGTKRSGQQQTVRTSSSVYTPDAKQRTTNGAVAPVATCRGSSAATQTLRFLIRAWSAAAACVAPQFKVPFGLVCTCRRHPREALRHGRLLASQAKQKPPPSVLLGFWQPLLIALAQRGQGKVSWAHDCRNAWSIQLSEGASTLGNAWLAQPVYLHIALLPHDRQYALRVPVARCRYRPLVQRR